MIRGSDWGLKTGETYEAPSQGMALFKGDGGWLFRAARWELWKVI
jgi:hypothetical protein